MTPQVPRNLIVARWLALAVPAALLAGVWAFQLIGHLYPCEMCHWQRWPHYAALVVALMAFVAPRRAVRAVVIVAALLIGVSGAIGLAHAGVEYHWWNGFTACTSTVTMTGTSAQDRLAAIMAAPLVRCDSPQWTLFGISLAGYNALVSLTASFSILALAARQSLAGR